MSAKVKKKQKKYPYLTKTILLPDGTRKYIRAKTQEEPDEKVLAAQMLMKSGMDIANDETFGHFAQIWYDIYKKPYLRENSLNSIKYVLNLHILPYLGGCRLRDITPMQIQAVMARLSDKSNSLQSKALVHLRGIFQAAEENGLVAKSPVSAMLNAQRQKDARKDRVDSAGEPPASRPGGEPPRKDVPADRPPHRNAARGDSRPQMGGR